MTTGPVTLLLGSLVRSLVTGLAGTTFRAKIVIGR